MNNEFLLTLAKHEGRQAWLGVKMPLRMEAIDLFNSTNFRVSAALHQKFSVVWIFEKILNDLSGNSWKIVLDEVIRLFAEEGYLVLKIRNTDKLSIPMVKSFLGRRIGIKCEVEYEEIRDSGVIVFKIFRECLDLYAAKKWSFAMLTMGDKVDNVISFLKSIREYDKLYENEILIVGPQNNAYDKYEIKYIDTKLFRDDKYAEICKKKNEIIKIATNPNLMIVHDRYILGEKFFEGFEEYGYDFDFLTVKQYDTEGNEFPSYSATKKKLLYSGQVQVDDYSKLYDTQYLNGGLLIFKTHIAKKIKFNNIIMWDQMEDVEISQIAIEKGIIPRINFLSTANTLLVKSGYLASWIKDSDEKDILESCYFIDTETNFSLIKLMSKHISVRFKQWKIYRILKRIIIH